MCISNGMQYYTAKAWLNKKMTRSQTKKTLNLSTCICHKLWIVTKVWNTQTDTHSLSMLEFPAMMMDGFSINDITTSEWCVIENQLVVSTHLKNMIVKLDHGSFPQGSGLKMSKIFELPPPSLELVKGWGFCCFCLIHSWKPWGQVRAPPGRVQQTTSKHSANEKPYMT